MIGVISADANDFHNLGFGSWVLGFGFENNLLPNPDTLIPILYSVFLILSPLKLSWYTVENPHFVSN